MAALSYKVALQKYLQFLKDITHVVHTLCSIPPTTESFHQNVLWAHFQCIVWNASLEIDPQILTLLNMIGNGMKVIKYYYQSWFLKELKLFQKKSWRYLHVAALLMNLVLNEIAPVKKCNYPVQLTGDVTNLVVPVHIQ